MSKTPAQWHIGFVSVAALLCVLSQPGLSAAQPCGLDAPQPVGPYLDGVFPTLAPQALDSSTWEVVDAFGFALPNTLVIERNPSDNRLYVGSRDGVIQSFENDENLSDPPDPFMNISDRVAVVSGGGFVGLAFHPDLGTPGADYQTTYLRLGRVGDQWIAEFSSDGASWSSAGSFSHSLAVSSVGVIASNFTPNPAYTSRVDYFTETSAP